MKQMLLALSPTPKQSFENFVTGQNIEVVHTLEQMIRIELSIHFIYLWGNEGSGKSHLAHIAFDHGFIIHDDVHLLDDQGQVELFNTYNRCKESQQNMLVTGLYSPLQMELREDLASRLAWGITYEVLALSDEEKKLALQKHANERGMKLNIEIIDYCLKYLKRDMPNLFSILEDLDKWSLTYKRPITLPLLKEIIAANKI
ncbi:MAG: DnaA regulatory inactivator Hda [Candidatus Methylopumilus sp.]|nr:DnaA regulatory inactivator Hda [Candidatus Methylopumilus sp.]